MFLCVVEEESAVCEGTAAGFGEGGVEFAGAGEDNVINYGGELGWLIGAFGGAAKGKLPW